MLIKIFYLSLLGLEILSLELPPEITRCSISDPNFLGCMSKSVSQTLKLFKDGNKEYGFPRLEPFHADLLEIAADPGKSVRLNQKYEDVYLHGITDAILTDIKMEDNENICRWEMHIYSNKTRMDADYEITGQVLLFPINGHGRCNVTLEGLLNKHVILCERYMKKGKTHVKFVDYKIDMHVEKCYFDFPNIIPGNEQLSNEVRKTLNENSLEIFQDVKGGFEEILSKLHQNVANALFSKVPEDQLFLP